MPSRPDLVFKDTEWRGWRCWLGTSNPTKTQRFLRFEEALAAARSLGLRTQAEWRLWCAGNARPSSMPPDPQKAYRHAGWKGWGHWLGTWDPHASGFLPFREGLVVARSLGLKTQREWNLWCRSSSRVPTVPCNPHTCYKNHGWQGFSHWLGRPDAVARAPTGGGKLPASTSAASAAAGKPRRASAPAEDTSDDGHEEEDLYTDVGPVVWAPWGKSKGKATNSARPLSPSPSLPFLLPPPTPCVLPRCLSQRTRRSIE